MEFRGQESYRRAVAFYRENGHLVVPKDGGKGNDLYDWVATQKKKYRSGELSPQKVELLEQLEITWSRSTNK